MITREQIWSAIEASAYGAPSPEADLISKQVKFSDYHDNDVIPNFYDTPFPAGPNQLIFNEAGMIDGLVKQIASNINGAHVLPERISYAIEHEKQHADPMVARGIAVKFGLTILEATSTDFRWQAFMFGHDAPNGVTKLEHAAFSLAPDTPSRDDEMRVRKMGYRSVDDLAMRIMQCNHSSGRPPLPLPGSARFPGNGLHRP